MFWKFNLLTSHIDTLLDKEDVTLQEILDEDDVLQECKAQNRRLVDFLIRPENIEELVNLVTQEPSDETDEKTRYKYPNTACELLTSDVTQITEKLSGEEALLTKVYSFLESEGPLNPLLASFFSKVMGLLITRKSEMMVEYLKSKEDFVGHLLHHIGTSAIMDLLLRLITCIESQDCRNECISWLNDQQLCQKLVAMMDASQSEEKHCNASQSLCDIIRMSREQMSQLQERADDDPLLNTIESQEAVTDLLNHMFTGEKVESVIVNGLAVIQTLLEFRKISSPFSPEGCQEQMTSLDAERLAQGVSNTLMALTPRLKDFHQLLVDPPKQHYTPMPTTIGCQDPPLGNTRLQVARLVATLLMTNTHGINVEMARLGTAGTLLDLFFKYVWNNFLHMQVEQVVATILTNTPTTSETPAGEDGVEKVDEKPESTPLLDQLFTEFKLLEKILDKWEDNDQNQSRPGGHRRGYMGHLTKIANHLVDNHEKSPNSERIKELVTEMPKECRERWETFTVGSLADLNKQNTVELVGSQGVHSSSEDEDTDFRNIPFPQDTAMQQARRKARLAFSDYQLQQMTSNFIDQFGFNEEEFNEPEARVDSMFAEGITSVNFEINSTETSANAATLFEQACNERMQQFGEDPESDDELWEEKELTFSQQNSNRQNASLSSAGSKGPIREGSDSDESTDSEEDLNSPSRITSAPASSSPPITAENMEVDSSEQNDEWSEFESAAPMDTAVSGSDTAAEGSSSTTTGEAWAQAPQSTSDDKPWAKFDGAEETKPDSQEKWADFSSFSKLDGESEASDSINPRSSSPVAMETSESSAAGRPAQYLVSSTPSESTSQSGDAQPSSSSDSPSPQSLNSTEGVDGEATVSSTTSEAGNADSPTAAGITEAEAEASSSAESSSTGARPKVVNSGSPVVTIPRCHDDDEEEGDLGDNFNFLAASGMIKGSGGGSEAEVSTPDSLESPQSPQSPQTEAAPSSSQEADADSSKIEEIRAQAREALEQYASATTTNTDSSTSQNGPV